MRIMHGRSEGAREGGRVMNKAVGMIVEKATFVALGQTTTCTNALP